MLKIDRVLLWMRSSLKPNYSASGKPTVITHSAFAPCRMTASMGIFFSYETFDANNKVLGIYPGLVSVCFHLLDNIYSFDLSNIP